MVAKVAGGIIGLGLIGTGSVAMAKPEWFGINKEIPWTPLSKDHSFSATGTNDYGTDKFGGKYKGVLTGVVGTDSTSGAKNTNEDWWNKSFEQLKIDSKISNSSVGEKFKYDDNKSNSKVNQGISGTSGEKGLNQICNEAYKAQDNKITDGGSGEGEYKKSDVWKYCSPLGTQPTTVKEAENKAGSSTSYQAGKLGKTNEEKLVSTTGNAKFWDLRDKEFKGIGKYQKIENEKDDFFNPEKNKTIKELCGEAYTKTAETSKSTKDAPTAAKALKYCSINKE